MTAGTDAITPSRSLDPQDRPDGLAMPSSGYSLRRAYADDGNVESVSNALAVVAYAYTPDRLDDGYSLTLSNGVTFTRDLARDGCRRSLVTGISSVANGAAVESFAYVHDALGRPVTRNADAFGYNARGEVVAATVAGNVEAHEYDGIGNSTIAAFNGVTNVCTANNLNQYVSVGRNVPVAPQTPFHYDVDGNMTQCGDWTYTCDAANRLYDNNGNVTRYLDANGTTVAQYTYDAFGRTISQTGPLAHVFRHRFSTKYFDAETGLYYYGYRFYSPVLRCWLTRDPIEERGGPNLYGFCGNNAMAKVDALGMDIIVIKHLPGERPLSGWGETDGGRCLALTVYRSPPYEVSEMKYPGGKIMFKVEIVPPNSFVDVYFRSLGDYMTKMKHESDHVSVARRHERAIHEFKRVVEAIHDCPTPARKAKEKAEMRLLEKVRELKAENESYDAPGGAHVL